VLLTHKVKQLPTAEQGAALLETMERFNEAWDFAAAAAFHIRSANKICLQ
jgi:hypothetical protein